MLTINISERDKVVMISLVGELSFGFVTEFEDIFKKYLNPEYEVVALDLKDMPYLDSFGMSRILKVSRKFSALEVGFVLINMNENTRLIFRMATFDRILNIMNEDDFILKYLISDKSAETFYTRTISRGSIPCRENKDIEIKHVSIEDESGVTHVRLDD